MITYNTITVGTEKPVAITCDVCGCFWDWDSLEAQEFISIREEGGFVSIFGDGTLIYLDICQKCFKEKLGGFIRVQ
jgi:hypothetical protein